MDKYIHKHFLKNIVQHEFNVYKGDLSGNPFICMVNLIDYNLPQDHIMIVGNINFETFDPINNVNDIRTNYELTLNNKDLIPIS